MFSSLHIPCSDTCVRLHAAGFPGKTLINSLNVESLFTFIRTEIVEDNAFYPKQDCYAIPLASEMFEYIPVTISVNNGERTYTLIHNKTHKGILLQYECNGDILSNPDNDEAYQVETISIVEAYAHLYLLLLEEGLIDKYGHVIPDLTI